MADNHSDNRTAGASPDESPAQEIPPEILADLEEVIRQVTAHGRVIDPELMRRVRERSKQASDELFQRHGLVDWAVPLIREIRDEE